MTSVKRDLVPDLIREARNAIYEAEEIRDLAGGYNRISSMADLNNATLKLLEAQAKALLAIAKSIPGD